MDYGWRLYNNCPPHTEEKDILNKKVRHYQTEVCYWCTFLFIRKSVSMKTETIAAIATAVSNSGIGIIRVSGDDAIEIVSRVFPKIKGMKSHSICYGFIQDGEKVVDEVMVSLMKGPKSYTKEDVVEINCHGGAMMMNRVLELVLKSGARLAEPGEFTKRAFLNGRIDLAKAEAVMDIIQSKNEFALKNSVNQLTGRVSESIRVLREDIIYQVAYIESALDDPEHISLDGYTDTLSVKVDDVLNKMEQLLRASENGKILKEGINTVIVGKPNAGKSSLLNLLAGKERAIVTDIAGTTRDVLEETIRVNGIVLNIIDTAGIRNTDDVIEKIGVERARKYALDADLIIYLVDTSVPLDENDKEIMDLIKDKKVIILLNKTDLESKICEEELINYYEDNNYPQVDNLVDKIIRTSTKENIGFDMFEKAIVDMFFNGEINVDEEVFITNMRHKEALQNAYESMLLVKKSLEDEMPEDFYTIDMMSAYADLGLIIGEEVEEDLVNEIFAKFCTGK